MIGNLYIIRNTVNDKVYIGKTYQAIERRFVEHKKEVKKGTKYKLYNAMRKHGIDNFNIELLGQFEEGLLEEKEIEYIAKYDSYRNGYNSTLGGDGYKRRVFDEEKILSDWENGISITKIAKKNGASSDTISNFLISKGVHWVDVTKNEKIKLIIYNKYWLRIRTFDSRKDSVSFINNELKMSVPHEVCRKIDNACKNGNIAYKHHWQRADQLFVGDMEFNTIWDKEDYLNGKEIELIDGVYWSIQRIAAVQELKENDEKRLKILKIREENRIIKKSFKKDKGNSKETKRKEKAIKTQKEKTIKEIDKNKIQKPKIPKKIINPEEMRVLLETNSADEVAKILNVTAKTIRKICRECGFPTPHEIYKEHTIKTYSTDIINLFNSGDSVHTISIKLKMSEDLIKEIIKSASNTRKRNTRPQIVEQYGLDGEYINTFVSMREAARSLGENIQSHKIAMCLDGRRKSAYGYIWKIKDKCV